MALNAEIEQLRRLEEVLVQQALDNGEEVTRDPASPCWALLGVKLATRAGRKVEVVGGADADGL